MTFHDLWGQIWFLTNWSQLQCDYSQKVLIKSKYKQRKNLKRAIFKHKNDIKWPFMTSEVKYCIRQIDLSYNVIIHRKFWKNQNINKGDIWKKVIFKHENDIKWPLMTSEVKHYFWQIACSYTFYIHRKFWWNQNISKKVMWEKVDF